MSDQAMTRAEVEEAISTRFGSLANRSITIKLEGDVFTGQSVGGLFDRLNEELDGLKLSTVYTGGGGQGAAPGLDDDAE